MPKSIKSYIIFTVVFIISLTFFFSSNALIGDTRKLKNDGYNQTVTLGGWEFKVSNATYNKETKIATFNIFSKEKEQEKSTKPNVYKISSSKDLNKELSFDSAKIAENNLGERYTVNDVEYGFYYIRLYIKVKESDIQPDDYVDEFGNIIKQEIIKGKEVEYWINIDYRLMNKEIENIQTTIQPFEDERPTDTLTHQSQANETTPNIASEQSNYPSAVPNYTINPSTSTVPSHHTTPKATTSSNPITPSIQGNPTSNSKAETNVPVSTTKSSTTKQTTSAPKSTTTVKTTAKTTAKITQATTTTETLPPILVTGIRLGTDFPNNNVQLTVGQSTVIRAIITPAEATNQKVTWTSNKPTVAYIDSTGKVIARTKGTVIITATTQDGNLTGACMVVVS